MENDRRVNFQRLTSEDSVYSEDSCEYYQTDIYDQLPSSVSRRRCQYRDQDDDDYEDFEYVSLLFRDWSPTQPLKTLPVCLQEKRNVRERRNQERLNISPWKSWRQSQQIARRRLREQLERFFSRLLPWKHTLHKIEGRFGVGVKAYFVFLRYLLCLNLLNCAIIAGSVLIPSLYDGAGGLSWRLEKNDSVLDVFLGTGFIQRSPVFYSFYKHKPLGPGCLNTSVLFLTGMVSILILSLIMIVRRTVVSYKHTWLTGNRFSGNTCNKVFCGWDFCIQDPQAALLKHSFIRNELKMDLEEQRFRLRVSQRTLQQRVLLYLLRAAVNSLVLLLLCGSFFLIYYASTTATSPLEQTYHWTLRLLWEYLPPITITLVNLLLPHVFSTISAFEDYSLATQLNITLVRSIFLKLASLGIFLFFLLNKRKVRQECMAIEFGKEMYKLTVFQFLACLCSVLAAYPRTLLVEKNPTSKLAQKMGKPEFVIPLNVLDLVYSQTVTWVGVYYCPLLPAISILKLLAIFYMKKFTLVRCCVPAQKMFRAASSSVLFNFILLLGLIMSAGTLVFHVHQYDGAAPKSGFLALHTDDLPFSSRLPSCLNSSTSKLNSGNLTMHNLTSACLGMLPEPAKNGIRYITSEAFAFALILAEAIILTSFISRGRANRKAIERLKDMLVMCSSDKRFLVKQHFTLMRRQKKAHPSAEEMGSLE